MSPFLSLRIWLKLTRELAPQRSPPTAYGLGSRASVGVNGAIGVRLRAPDAGNEVTTSGSKRLLSA